MTVIPLPAQTHLHLAAREVGADEMALSFPLDADGVKRVLADAGITNPALAAAIDLGSPSAFASIPGGQVGVIRCDGDCEATRAVLAAEGTGGR
ncbi:hypothetical protein [Acrocarpospora catenulata]|uniref:hypothetical protein n=1 Tax=Acrocarpospora catenulata TaxID=2836182 RepID=UPI001BD91C3C|nr:hypothetical protein [Acrocarpospora catenulata]